MATRQEIQIAYDLIRFINVVNDLLDSSVPLAKGLIKTRMDEATERDMTVNEIKDALRRVCQNVYGYKTVILNFLNVPGNKQLAINGLIAWGVNLDNTKKELVDMLTVVDYVNTEVEKVTTSDELKTLGDYIDANVPKLPLVRKS